MKIFLGRIDRRVNNLENQQETQNLRIQQNSKVSSMTNDYAIGIHHGLIEAGGFVRDITGGDQQRWEEMMRVERGNMISRQCDG